MTISILNKKKREKKDYIMKLLTIIAITDNAYKACSGANVSSNTDYIFIFFTSNLMTISIINFVNGTSINNVTEEIIHKLNTHKTGFASNNPGSNK